jgi:fumarylacetoacetate (FAA) hydrolase
VKLATLRNGSRDGALAVVSRDLTRAIKTPQIAPSLQAALDDWTRAEPLLQEVAASLESRRLEGEVGFNATHAMAPLPRAYQWADFSAYVTHVELVRKSRGADVPATFWTDPLVYQGGGDCNLGPTDPIPLIDPAHGLDFEGEVGVIVDDVPAGASPQDAAAHVKLLVLINDLTLRNLVATELGKGFGFFQSKPQTAFSPVAVTPDELREAWDGHRVHLHLQVSRGDELFGAPNAGRDMVFGFPQLIAHAARTRPICAGGVIGSGTVSNADRRMGSACIAERRAEETLRHGNPKTPYLGSGERVRIEMFDNDKRSVFGAIDQIVAAPSAA